MYVLLEKLFTHNLKYEWCYINTYQNARQAREAAQEYKKRSKQPLQIVTYKAWKKSVKRIY